MVEQMDGSLQRHLWGVDASDPSRRRARIRNALDGFSSRLTVQPSTDHAAWSDPPSAMTHKILAVAEAEATLPWPVVLASDYVRYFRDGNRNAYEMTAAKLRERTALFTVAAGLTDDARWVDHAADGAVLLCELSTWCWAAHERFSMAVGDVLPDPAHPYIDLGAGEVLALLAWADRVLGPRWDERWPGLRRRIRREADLRVFEPFRLDRSWHWLGIDELPHNWTAWVHSNVAVGALLLIDDARIRAETMDLALEGLSRYVAVIPEDGGCDEGFEYWWNAPVRAIEAFALLAEASAGAIHALTLPALAEAGRFPVRMHLGGAWFVNVADSSARAQPAPWHLLHQWGHTLSDKGMTSLAESMGRGAVPAASGGLGRMLSAIVDPSWTALSPAARTSDGGARLTAPIANVRAAGMLPAQSWFGDTELLVARERSGSSDGLTLTIKGGHNAERHNHNDVGSYLVAVDGIPVVVDVGRPTYTRETFSDKRYGLWPMQSLWHNVLLLLAEEPGVSHCGQSAGAEYRARSVQAELSDSSASMVLEGSAAYPRGLEMWQRRATLDRDLSQVRVVDTWATSPAYRCAIAHVLHGRVVLDAESGRVVVTPEQLVASGRGAVLSWDPEVVEPVLETKALEDPMMTAVWGDHLTRLLLVARDGVKNVLVTIEAL